MRLPSPTPPLSVSEQLAEFDMWITASLGEIRDTERFQSELYGVVRIFEALHQRTNGFAETHHCSPEAVADALLKLVEAKPVEDASQILQEAASVLFLVTGKSDNNAKCQLPLHLRDKAKWTTYPRVRRTRGRTTLQNVSVPRVLQSKDYMQLVALLTGHPEQQARLLTEFVRFVLSDEKCVAQLWSIGRSYSFMKGFHHEKDLLTPLVVFQVRGSVSASGGHAPEDLLRQRFDEWGLRRNIDYNTTDVVLEQEPAAVRHAGREKTRAYDFVLPFRAEGWAQRVFIQCQFYAGDSGSVSHKNVDQTRTSRDKVRAHVKNPVFVEYVDGAGYFSSLNGDLETLFSMANTDSFFQVRTAAIRLRRSLQDIGFLTPLDLEHAIVRTDGTADSVVGLLSSEGYARSEIERCAEACRGAGRIVVPAQGRWSVLPERVPTVRRYLLLDTVACYGKKLDAAGNRPAGFLTVPGFGPFHGLKLAESAGIAIKIAPGLAMALSDSQTMLGDIQWLEEQRFLMSS
jgi:hypothetical protein